MAPSVALGDLTFGKCLGRGFFGEVWRAKDAGGGTFAVKKVKRSLVQENQLTEQLQREIRIMYSLRHPRIIKLYFDLEDPAFVYLGMEFAAGGCLFDKLSRSGAALARDVAGRYFLETCEALDYLHHLPQKVIHRDIKPENILLDADGHVKLADFGWANLLQANKRDTFCGTLDYLPPEMIMGVGHDESADMWNMGVLLYELTTGRSPFSSASKEATCRLILAVDLRFPPEMDAGAQDLVSKLCRKKPAERLSVRQAMEHDFISSSTGQRPPTGGTAAVDGALADDRYSVVERRLREDREKVSAEMEVLVKAKQGTEEALMRVSEDIDQQHGLAQSERRRRCELSAACDVLELEVEARDAEIAELRKRLESAQAEASRLRRSGVRSSTGWWARRRESRTQEPLSPTAKGKDEEGEPI